MKETNSVRTLECFNVWTKCLFDAHPTRDTHKHYSCSNKQILLSAFLLKIPGQICFDLKTCLALDESPTRSHFNPAAEPLLLVDSGVPVTRRGSSCASHISNLSGTTPPPPFKNNTRMGTEGSEPKSLLRSLKNYPTSVFFILGNEFCERFSFYGMRAILTLYLVTTGIVRVNEINSRLTSTNFKTARLPCYTMHLSLWLTSLRSLDQVRYKRRC